MDTSNGIRVLSAFNFVILNRLSDLYYFNTSNRLLTRCPELQPFVDQGHPLQSYFPPRVWAIRIPVILILIGTTVVGSFLAMVMIRSNQKKAAKAKAAEKGKKKA